MTRHRLGLSVMVLLAACGGGGGSSGVDAGPRRDAGGPEDAGREDAGSMPDAGESDSGLDAGREDAGSMPDAGESDSGLDAGLEDAGPPDTGVVDAGVDAGPPAPTCCTEAAWDVDEGIAPEDDCVPWTPVGAASFGAAGVTFATTTASANELYTHVAPTIDAGDQVRIRFRMRSVSNTSSAAWRTSAGVIFAFGPSRAKNTLYVGDGEIFLLSSENARGMAASVPTSDAMHDYVIDVDRTTGAIAVSYDGTPTLTGSLFVTPSDTTTDLISWGEVSSVASGESVWEHFEHDAWTGCHRAAWDASEAVLPDLDCPPWTEIDSAPADEPVLGAGGVTLATANDAENLAYVHERVDAGTRARIAFRMRLVSSTSSASWRSGAGVAFTFGPTRQKNSLYVGDGEIFLLSAENTRGMAASVPTTDAMHDYVIEVDRTTGAVSVSYDGTPTLTGSLFVTPSDTVTDRILWGELSMVAHGESVWESFEHDAFDGCSM